MIRVGDILWDEENFVDENGNNKFTYQEALNIAKKYGKRLPRKNEVEAFFNLFAYAFNENGILKIPSYGLTFKYKGCHQMWIEQIGYSETYPYLFIDKDTISIIPTKDQNKKFCVRLVDDVYECGEFIPWEEKRCDIASKAMQSLITYSPLEEDTDWVIKRSVEFADKLIERLRGDKSHGI